MRLSRHIIPAGALTALLGMFAVWPSGSPSRNLSSEKTPDHPPQERREGTGQATQEAGPALTKRSVRDMGRKPTEGETEALLQTTIISKIDVEDATLEETVAELNRLARSHGIPERELTFLIGHRLSKNLGSSPFRIKELRIRNAPLVVLMKYVCGNTKIRCRTSPGRVTFGSYDDFDEEPVSAVKAENRPDDDPFAEPGQKKPATPDGPLFPTDSGEADPFAELGPSSELK